MRVVLAEDEALMREGLALVLERAGFEVVGTAGDLDDLLRKVRGHRPELVITDLRMPPTHTDEGLRAARAIRAESPAPAAVVVLSQHVHGSYALELLEQGTAGVGYLLKQRVADVEAFGRDLRRVCGGGTVLDPQVVAAMLARARRVDVAVDGLTPRQAEVLELMASGRSNAAIADRMTISQKAVVSHVSHIYGALGLPLDADDHRRVLAVVRYLSARRVPPGGAAFRQPQ